MDAHGIVLDRRPGTLHHEQCFRGHDLVLLASILGYLQRYLCIHLRHHFRPHTAHQVVS
jgi:hypothetical protein